MQKADSCTAEALPWPTSKPPLLRRSKSLDRLDSGTAQLPAEEALPASDEDGQGIPVFVMLPLDTVRALPAVWHAAQRPLAVCSSACCMQVTMEGIFRYASAAWFHQALATLANSGIHGIAVDVWVSEATLQTVPCALKSMLQRLQSTHCVAAASQHMQWRSMLWA